ncbi:response regulator transcription factor [Chloroflexota bacterium]
MKKKILVIEDNPSSLRLVQYTFEHKGYEVLTAPNGLEGLRKARSEKPDLVILDVMLPGIDGFEVSHRLRAEAQTAHLPLLMLSAKAREEDKDIGIKAGADEYLAKPASPSEIVNRAEKLLAREPDSRRPTHAVRSRGA